LTDDSGRSVVQPGKDKLLAHLVAVFGLIEAATLELGSDRHFFLLAVALHRSQR
jgi:hypothetical protein